jgi:uncharacterized protein (TIGR02246 family)
VADRGEVRALVERQARAWESGDLDTITADFAPGGVLVSPGGSWRGREAIREAAERFFASVEGVKVEVTRVISDGDAGAVEWTWTERRADGEFTARDAIVFELRDGRIAYWREYFDPAELEGSSGGGAG